jgi:hypothetical protein
MGDVGRSDAGGSLEAGSADGGAPEGERVHLELDDGTELSGELVAEYDHSRWWWMASDEVTRALFRADLLAPWPDDRSTSFVASSRVVRLWREPLPESTPRFRDAMRARGLVLGRVPIDGVVHVVAGHERHHLEESGYGDFAWDLVRTDAAGARYTGDGTSNEDYLIWDAEVFIPVRGYVVEVERDQPDSLPGATGLDRVNNLVGVQVFGGYYFYFLHFRQGSIPAEIAVGSVLEAGAYLGRVGNSGVSIEPHLHLTAMALDRDAMPSRLWSVPSEHADVWVATSPTGPARRAEHHDPTSGEWISSEPF